jgi:hypothetical protein
MSGSVWLIEYLHPGGVWLVNTARGVFDSAVAAEKVASSLRRQYPNTQYRGAEYAKVGGAA